MQWVVLLVFSLACTGIVWFLIRDRAYWQAQYQELDRQTREREHQLIDQLLRKQGGKPLQSQAEPLKREVKEKLSPEDLSLYEDKLKERVEMGLMTDVQRQSLVTDAKQMTQAELDRVLWMNPAEMYTGSEDELF